MNQTCAVCDANFDYIGGTQDGVRYHYLCPKCSELVCIVMYGSIPNAGMKRIQIDYGSAIAKGSEWDDVIVECRGRCRQCGENHEGV
jgi:hypothetical protein